MRRHHLTLAITAMMALALSAAALYDPIRSASESAASEPIPLPPGPPRLGLGEAAVERATLDDMVASATVVFLGRVTAIGGSEVVSPASAVEGPELTVRRTRFDVIEAMRGDASIVDVAQFDWGEPVSFEVGMTYLVFAETRQLGSLKLPYLVPFGYLQGVYVEIAPGVFANDMNGSIEIGALRERLRSSALTR